MNNHLINNNITLNEYIDNFEDTLTLTKDMLNEFLEIIKDYILKLLKNIYLDFNASYTYIYNFCNNLEFVKINNIRNSSITFNLIINYVKNTIFEYIKTIIDDLEHKDNLDFLKCYINHYIYFYNSVKTCNKLFSYNIKKIYSANNSAFDFNANCLPYGH